jgi:outer membrane assembly lipoprotein YfiO
MLSRRHIITNLILAVVVFSLFSASCAYAFWVWTPQSGKWVNPKYAPKDTSKEQFDWAMSFYNAKDYARAAKEFEQISRHFRDSEVAPEAQYYAGISYEKTNAYYRAYLAYKKAQEQYPANKRFQEVTARIFAIAELFRKGTKAKLLGLAILPAEDKAIEMYKHICETAPFSKEGPRARFNLGLTYMKVGDYGSAREQFLKVIEDYPQHKLVEEARYQLALASYKGAKKPYYDQSGSEEAIGELKDFIVQNPESKMAPVAKAALSSLKENKAESLFVIGEFYRKQHKFTAAKVYFEEILADYPDTTWAAKARERIAKMPLTRKGK